MRKAALGLWLFGSITALSLSLMGLLRHISSYTEEIMVVLGGNIYIYQGLGRHILLGFILATIIGVESVAVIILAIIKSQDGSSTWALTATIICCTGYISIYWFSGVYVPSSDWGGSGLFAFLILPFCVTLMILGSYLFIRERRSRLRTEVAS